MTSLHASLLLTGITEARELLVAKMRGLADKNLFAVVNALHRSG
jgi:hypothetical protein